MLIVPEGQCYGIPAVNGIGQKIGRSRVKRVEHTTARTILRTIESEEIGL